VRSALVLLLFGCAEDPSDAPTGPGSWETLAPAPTARSEAGVALVEDKIVTIAGFSSAVEIYDLAADTWTSGPDFVAPADHLTAAGLMDDRVLVAGWQAGGSHAETFLFDLDEAAWPSAEPLPRRTGAAAMVRAGDLVLLIGGADGDALPDLQIYDVAAGVWRAGPPMRVPRHHLAAAEAGGKVYAMGGRNDSSFTLDTVEVFDLASERWSDGPPLQVGRSGHAAAAAGGKIYVFGGEGAPYEGGVFPEVEELDPLNGTWRFVARMPTPRHGIQAVTVGDRIYVPIGADQQGFFNTDVFEVFIVP
jgi:hypothetical protein